MDSQQIVQSVAHSKKTASSKRQAIENKNSFESVLFKS
jgi:hypothetical protein